MMRHLIMTISPNSRGWRLSRTLFLLRRITRSRAVQHTGFWMLSVCILTLGFSMSWPVTMADVIYTVLFHISLILAVYVHLRVCVHYLLMRKKYLLYFSTLIVLLSCAVLLNVWTYTYLSDWVFPGYYFISYYNYWEIALFIGVYLLITTLLKFSRSWADLQRTKLVLEETKRRSAETELRALRDQVNPHFLFNSLHSIYALALDRSERTADLVLRLSDILRFLVYESKTETIPLSREIECVEAFIALQRERLAESARVEFVKRLEGNDPEIAPLLLMPLVENAFKHGVLGKDTLINLELRWRDGKLDFSISNRIGMKSETQETGGVGLQNLKRRLTLQYPTRHKLEINSSSDMYLVHLSIDLS